MGLRGWLVVADRHGAGLVGWVGLGSICTEPAIQGNRLAGSVVVLFGVLAIDQK